MRTKKLFGNPVKSSIRPFRTLLTANGAIFAFDMNLNKVKLNPANIIFVKLKVMLLVAGVELKSVNSIT